MPEPTALIFNIMRFAVQDGPGIRTTVFFKGCPLACAWCHNPESQSFRLDVLYSRDRCVLCGDCAAACPEHAITRVNGSMATSFALCVRCGACLEHCATEARQIAGRRITLGELIAEIEKDVVFFDESGGGVTLSGGEPLSQPHFASALLRECRKRGIHSVLETCGFAHRATFLEVAGCADLVLFDLKLPDPEKHRRYTGVPNEMILGNLEALAASGRPTLVRIPVVPGINDSDSDIDAFAGLLSHAGVRVVELLPYHRTAIDKYERMGATYRCADTTEPTPAGMARFAGALTGAGIEVANGG
jgi:pyruvate formate lyase activating enzyme